MVDVRLEEEFDAGHIAGARSIPLEELEQRLADLPADQEIVAYCRGPSVHTRMRPFASYELSAVTRSRLEDGWPEWRLAESKSKRRKVA